MTYGDNVGEIRNELALLLRHHRIQQRLGGPGSHTMPVTTTADQREAMGRAVMVYRYAVLTWCRLGFEAVNPKTDLRRLPASERSPSEELRHRLVRATQGCIEGPPLMELLGTKHRFELLRSWQRAARAAALGEHDFTADVNWGRLAPAQGLAVARDVAEVVQGLVVLDQRYKNVPGWKGLKNPVRLSRAAQHACNSIGDDSQDFGVDALGWSPVRPVVRQPAQSGVAGAVLAQHGLLAELEHPPNALNLRRVLHAQAQVSSVAARHATMLVPELAQRFTERAQVYRRLVAQSRDLGGLVGGGGQAVAEAQDTMARLANARVDVPGERAALHQLQHAFASTDARLATLIERGLAEKLYFVSVGVPRMTKQQINGVFQPRRRWMPVTSADQSNLLPLVRQDLMPPPLVRPRCAAGEVRRAYQEALRGQARPRGSRTR